MTGASRLLAMLAPILCAAGVALGAYASHAGIDPLGRERLGIAALFCFGHGLGLIALQARASRIALIARWSLAAGVAVFSGSLAAAALFDVHAVAAPGGGLLIIVAWLLLSVDAAKCGDAGAQLPD